MSLQILIYPLLQRQFNNITKCIRVNYKSFHLNEENILTPEKPLWAQRHIKSVYFHIFPFFWSCFMQNTDSSSLSVLKDKLNFSCTKYALAQSRHTLLEQQDDKSVVYLHGVGGYWPAVWCRAYKCNFLLVSGAWKRSIAFTVDVRTVHHTASNHRGDSCLTPPSTPNRPHLVHTFIYCKKPFSSYVSAFHKTPSLGKHSGWRRRLRCFCRFFFLAQLYLQWNDRLNKKCVNFYLLAHLFLSVRLEVSGGSEFYFITIYSILWLCLSSVASTLCCTSFMAGPFPLFCSD